MKKVLIIIISIILVALVILAGWFLFLRNPDNPLVETVRDVLPFGSAPTPSGVGVPSSSPTGASEATNAGQTSNLFLISRDPVAGAVLFNRGSTTTFVRYVDRATGHIYDANLATRVKTKVTNQTLPKIYEAYFKSDGTSVLLRSLKDNSDVVENFSLSLTPPKATTTGALYTASSTALRGDISAIAVGSGNTLFYALRDASSIVTSTFGGTGLKTLLNSPFKDWRLASAGNSLVAYTKASSGADGYAYSINTSSGALTKILGPLNGLVVMPNTTNNQVVYSYTENGKTRAFAKNLKTNILSEIASTIAEKCIWSIKNINTLYCAIPNEEIISGSEPDNWYRGLTHFSDRLWIFDTKVGISQVLVEPKPSLNIDIDAIDLKLSLNEDYLVFTNKTDLSLWALKLEKF